MISPEPRDTTPIATVDDYRAALLRVRDRYGIAHTDLAIFRAFRDASDHTLTAPKLATAANLATWHEANLRLGTLARYIGEALRFTPSKRRNGSFRWWMSIAHGAGEDEEDTGYFQWTLRPELLEALKAIKWI